MCLPPSVLAWVWRGRFVGVHSHGGWSSTIGDKALCHNLWWVGLPQLETKLNAIICGGLVFHNLRHFFLFAINHGKCSCLFLQRMPINWHSMKRRDPSQKSPTIPLF